MNQKEKETEKVQDWGGKKGKQKIALKIRVEHESKEIDRKVGSSTDARWMLLLHPLKQ